MINPSGLIGLFPRPVAPSKTMDFQRNAVISSTSLGQRIEGGYFIPPASGGLLSK
jgi:hypothetical protein